MEPNWGWALTEPVTATLVEASLGTEHMIVLVYGPRPGQAITLTSGEEYVLVNGVRAGMGDDQEAMLRSIIEAAYEQSGLPIKIPAATKATTYMNGDMVVDLGEFDDTAIPQACILEGTGVYYEILGVSTMFWEDGTTSPVIELGSVTSY